LVGGGIKFCVKVKRKLKRFLRVLILKEGEGKEERGNVLKKGS